jgi:kynurenine formamidase
MKVKRIVDLTHYWGSKEMVVARYEGGQKVWVPKKFGRDRNEWGALDKRDYRVEIKDWLYSDGALTPDITIFSHAGTHLEAPGYHVINAPEHLKQKGIADYPPDRFIGEAAVIDLSSFARKAGADGPEPDHKHFMPSLYQAAKEPGKGTAPRGQMKIVPISAKELSQFDHLVKPGDILLPVNKVGGSIVALDVNWIIDRGVKMVGMEMGTLWFYGERDGMTNAHDILLSHEILIIEGLRNLGKITKERVFYIGMPLKLLGVGACPIWAIAIEEFDDTPL